MASEVDTVSSCFWLCVATKQVCGHREAMALRQQWLVSLGIKMQLGQVADPAL